MFEHGSADQPQFALEVGFELMKSGRGDNLIEKLNEQTFKFEQVFLQKNGEIGVVCRCVGGGIASKFKHGESFPVDGLWKNHPARKGPLKSSPSRAKNDELSGSSSTQPRLFHEILGQIGIAPEIPADVGKQYELYERIPVCFVRAIELGKEVPENEIRGNDVRKLTVLSIINKERECDGFSEWIQGTSPKEHQVTSMLVAEKRRQEERHEADMRRIEESRLRDQQREEHRVKEEERRRNEDLAWRSEQDRLTNERWAQEQKEAAARWKDDSWWQKIQLLIVGVIATIILTIAQIVGSLIQAGILFPQEKEKQVINVNIPDVRTHNKNN